MIFRYWVRFDENGDISGFSKSKADCEGCKEYIVKLIPIDRQNEDLKASTDRFLETTERTLGGMKKFRTELDKVAKDLRRIKR